MSLLQNEVVKALGDNPLSVEAEGAAADRARMVLELTEAQKPSLWDIHPLSVEAEGAAADRARMVLELTEAQKPSLWDILNKHDERQRALILTLKAENAVLEAQLKWCQQELLKQAQQGSVNVLNAALAGIELGKRGGEGES